MLPGDVHRLELPTPFAIGPVSSWLLRGDPLTLVDGGAVVTAELADLAVDQCALLEGRFTMIAPDDYRGDTLDVALFDRRGQEVARESLYAEDDEDDEE